MVQGKLDFGQWKKRPAKPGWGGVREGAGRPRKDGRKGMQPGHVHLKRPVLKRRFPVHVTWRIAGDVWSLRGARLSVEVKRALWRGSDKGSFRLVHYAILRDHIHMLVEADDRRSLSRGLQGLGVRLARAVNRLQKRKGRVVADRYHEHILLTPTEVIHARRYLLNNSFKHYGPYGNYKHVTQQPLVAPQTWLLQLRAIPSAKSAAARKTHDPPIQARP